MENLKRITVTEAKFPQEPDFTSLSFTFKTAGQSVQLNLGESKEILAGDLDLEINSNIHQISSSLNIHQQEEYELNLDEGVTLKILAQSIHSKPTLSIPGLAAEQPSSCEYLRKLQEIEGEEREISSLLAHSKMKAPAGYRDYFDSSPSSSAKKSPLKKKTLDPEGFSQLQPDFQFSSYFDINLENISSSEGKLLEHATFGMMSKLQSLKPDVEEYELTQEIIYEFDSPIKNLKESLEESKNEFDREKEGIERVKQRILNETQEIEKELESVDEENNGLSQEIEKLREEIQRLNQQNLNERSQEGLSETQQLRLKLEGLQHEIKDLENEYLKIEKEFNKNYPEQELAKVINEKVMKLGELQRMVTVRDSALQEGLLLSAELAELEALKSIQDDQDEVIEKYQEEQAGYESSNKHTNLQLKEILGETEDNLRVTQSELTDLESSLNPLQGESEASQLVFSQKSENLSEVQGKLEEVLKGNSNLSIILEKEQQIVDDYKNLQKQFKGSVLGQKALMHEIENLSNSLLKVANNSITSGRLLRRTEDMVEEQELQQVSMYKLIALIKETKPAYIAVQNDSTDMALAKYLNARHKTLDIGFKRTDKEKYAFGTMKVEIKLEDDLSVLFDSKKFAIEEFLETFTLIEKEKTIKRSTSKVSEKEKKETKPLAKVGKAPLIPLTQILKRAK